MARMCKKCGIEHTHCEECEGMGVRDGSLEEVGLWVCRGCFGSGLSSHPREDVAGVVQSVGTADTAHPVVQAAMWDAN